MVVKGFVKYKAYWCQFQEADIERVLLLYAKTNELIFNKFPTMSILERVDFAISNALCSDWYGDRLTIRLQNSMLVAALLLTVTATSNQLHLTTYFRRGEQILGFTVLSIPKRHMQHLFSCFHIFGRLFCGKCHVQSIHWSWSLCTDYQAILHQELVRYVLLFERFYFHLRCAPACGKTIMQRMQWSVCNLDPSGHYDASLRRTS